MPFTPAHVAITLPFLKIRSDRVSASALVIGSIAPDFEYFLKMAVSSQYSHTLLGILYFDIPITIILTLLFHQVVKKNLIGNLPAFLQYRFQPVLNFDFKEYFRKHYWVIVFSAAAGSFSHIFWDAFTHNDGFFAQRISYYKHVVIPFEGVRYPLFYGLQQISTFTGLAILLAYIIFITPDKSKRVTSPTFLYWALLLLVAALVVFLRFFFDPSSMDLGNFVVSSISAILVALLVGGLVKFNRQAIS